MLDMFIFLVDHIDDHTANIIQAQLVFLQSTDAKRDIQVYLNSPGGSVYAGLGIYDTMQYIQPDVATICTGMAASMAAVLLCAGTEGKQAALKHARDRKSTRLNSSHKCAYRMPSYACKKKNEID